MAASSLVDGVRALAAPAAASAGLVLEDVTITPAGRRRVLRVIVDLPEDSVGGVPMEAVAQASHALSEALDSSPVMGGAPYVLEVSSPGADRPLTERRHWLRARGRLVSAILDDGSTVGGRLMAASDEGLVLDRADAEALSWARVRSGRIELEFARPDGADDDLLDDIAGDGIADETDNDTDDDTDDDEGEA